MHGGSTEKSRAKAARVLAEEAARKRLANLHEVTPVTDAVVALETLAGEAVGLVEVLRSMVGDLEQVRYRGGPGSGTEQLRGELAAYISALGRAESILRHIVGLDLDARRVRLAEAQVGAVVSALDQVLASPDLGLDTAQQRRGRELLAHLLAGRTVPRVLVEVPAKESAQLSRGTR